MARKPRTAGMLQPTTRRRYTVASAARVTTLEQQPSRRTHDHNIKERSYNIVCNGLGVNDDVSDPRLAIAADCIAV